MDSAHPTTSVVTNTNKRLEGHVAIVTGGASRIGASTVRLFTENGAKVVIADIQDELGQSLSDELGSNVSFRHCDVSLEGDVRALVDETVANHGRLDIMYSNAGILDRVGGTILDSTSEEMSRVISVNLCGAFYAAKHAARAMIPRKRGCILFTASTCETPIKGVVASNPYVMSKYGIMGLVKNLSGELGMYSIRVNCVSPSGVVDTAMRPFAGFGGDDVAEAVDRLVAGDDTMKISLVTAESVARAALYMASDDAAFVTGHNLVLDAALFNGASHF